MGKPNGQNEKYKELCCLSSKLSRDISNLSKRKRTIDKLIKRYICCEFCEKHFKRIKTNLSKEFVVKTEVRTEYVSSSCEFDKDVWNDNEYKIYYKPYICPYCNKPQVFREHVEDYHTVFVRKVK